MNDPTSPHPSRSADQRGRVLVLAPDGQLAVAIRAALLEAAPEAQVDVARSLEEAQHVVVSQKPDLFVLDVDGTYDFGQGFLYDLRTSHPHARAIVLTAVRLASHRENAAGLGAIHFLEKPFRHADFIDLVRALLQPGGQADVKFQGTLSDLHIADIIQLKCMSGGTSVLEFTGPRGEKARVFFEDGQVRHATAPAKEGVPAFNEIVNWKSGVISEVCGAGSSPRTINRDWQTLLMEAVRKMDETRDTTENGAARAAANNAPARRKVLVIDDSPMLLNFAKETLTEANYEVVAAATGDGGLRVAEAQTPELILLDPVLPDMKGDEVLRRLLENPATAKVPVVYMSGFGTDLPSDPRQSPNMIGALNKPFTSELLLQAVQTHMPESAAEPKAESPMQTTPAGSAAQPVENSRPFENRFEPAQAPLAAPQNRGQSSAETARIEQTASSKMEETVGGTNDAWWSAAPSAATSPSPEVVVPTSALSFESPPQEGASGSDPSAADIPVPSGTAFFCGDTSFFSLHWALQTIASEKLTGTLRAFWNRETVQLLARDGQIVLVTTRDPELYCSEEPITLVNIEPEKTNAAREQQRETGQPLFLILAQEGLIIHEPAVQLVQHYGQKLFAQLWCAPRVRFMFEQSDELPDYLEGLPTDDDVDHWALSTLRFIQFQELGTQADYDPALIPAYTRDGFDRVQRLRLTVAEAQFASQFNGARSIAQIARNLRLDLKFARLTLFRFLALEIVECWPPAAVGAKQEKRGVFGRIFGD